MAGHDIIVVGASAGGIPALARLLHLLPAELPASICIVQHTAPTSPGLLDRILGRESRLPTCIAEDRMPLALGTAYIAPPDRHLLLEPGLVRVVRGPRENLHRPSLDPLFRSAASAYGPRVIGVVLTGLLDDGTAGLQAIKTAGGVTVVQDPGEAEFPSMPTSALASVVIDHCLPIEGLAALLVELAGEPERMEPPRPERASLGWEAGMAAGGHNDPEALDGLGQVSHFTCPECHGALWELDDEAVLRFRCHVGHAFTANTLQAAQAGDQERVLWVALRALEEQAALFARMAHRAHGRGQEAMGQRFQQRNAEYRDDADALRAMLRRESPPAPTDPVPGLLGLEPGGGRKNDGLGSLSAYPSPAS